MKLAKLLLQSNQALIEQALQKRFSQNLALFSQINPKLYEQLLMPPQNYNLFLTRMESI